MGTGDSNLIPSQQLFTVVLFRTIVVNEMKVMVWMQQYLMVKCNSAWKMKEILFMIQLTLTTIKDVKLLV